MTINKLTPAALRKLGETAEETKAKPETDVVELLLKEHNLQRRDILMIENSETDRHCAEACGIDVLNVKEFL